MTEQPGKNRTKLWLSCLLSAAIACLLVLAVYALRGIWPFGGGNIAYVDDAQYYVPGFYATWDYFHGVAAGSVSWYSGLAGTTSGSFSDWLELPYLVFLLVPRERVMESLSLLLLAYLALIAAVAAFVAGRRLPHIGTAAVTAIALCYTLSGFVLQYYSIFSWLYNVALFPLILWGLERLLREGKWKLYAAFMTVSLLRSIYTSYMVCVYVILFAMLYLLFVTPRQERGDRAVRLGFSTAAALGLSAFRWLRSSAKLAGTSRFQSNVDAGVMSWMTTLNQDYVRHTLLMALGLALAAALLLRLWLDARREGLSPAYKKTARFALCMLATLFIPMVLTNVDTMWHFGTYNFFPMRYGYMLPATVLGAAGLALETRVTQPESAAPAASGGRPLLPVLFGALCAAAAAALMTGVVPLWQKYGTCFIDVLSKADYARYWLMLAAAALLWVGAFWFLLRLRGRLRVWLVLAALVLQLGVNAFGLLGPDDSQVGYLEYSDVYVHQADDLHAYFAAREPDVFDRAKNVDSCLNGGYPTIAGIGALSSSSSSCPGADLEAAELLGYSTNYFMLLDTGGTVLTDMLLGVKYALSQTGFDAQLYTHADTVGATDVALANYPLRQGLLYSAGALADYDRCADIPARLNLLYGAFTGSADAARNADADFSCEGEPMPACTLRFEAEEAQFVYFAVEMAAIRITVNGRAVAVPTYGDPDSETYPSQFNNNLLYLGCFENETVTVSFLSPTPLTREDVTLFTVSRAAVESFDAAARRAQGFTCAQADGVLTVTAETASAGQLLYLPLRCSVDWKVTVNGREVGEEPVMGLCIGVPLEAGENTVVIARAASALAGKGLVISALSLLLTAAYLLLARRKTGFFAAPPPAALCTAAGWLFALLCAGLVCFIYLGPAAALLLRTLGVL